MNRIGEIISPCITPLLPTTPLYNIQAIYPPLKQLKFTTRKPILYTVITSGYIIFAHRLFRVYYSKFMSLLSFLPQGITYGLLLIVVYFSVFMWPSCCHNSWLCGPFTLKIPYYPIPVVLTWNLPLSIDYNCRIVCNKTVVVVCLPYKVALVKSNLTKLT